MYPKKELPFFILFTAGLCTVTALLALLTHSYPESMGAFAKTVSPVVAADEDDVEDARDAGERRKPVACCHSLSCLTSDP